MRFWSTPSSSIARRLRKTTGYVLHRVSLCYCLHFRAHASVDVEANYRKFDAFVILMGTDVSSSLAFFRIEALIRFIQTMAYTASALSFLLENLGKPVVVTGAQIPLSESFRNDSVENLLGALSIVRYYSIPEVCLFFNNKLLRGNRTTKSSAFEAFTSPNLPPLGKIGISIDIDWQAILRPTALKPFTAHKRLSPDVSRLAIYPGLSATTLKAILAP